jgi:TPR repeat protein
MCTTKTNEISEQASGYVTSSIFRLSESELAQNIPDALKGDPEAAYRIALHLGFVSRDPITGYEWVEIAIENGNLNAQIFYTRVFVYDENKYFSTRGIFWLYGLAIISYDEYYEYYGESAKYYVEDAEIQLNRFGYSTETAKPPDDDQFPHDFSQLSETELSACETGALQGNRKASFLLGKYYGEIAADNELSEFWYRIGAQNGNPACMYELGQIMSKKNDPLDQTRGKFWLGKAGQNGYNL